MACIRDVLGFWRGVIALIKKDWRKPGSQCAHVSVLERWDYRIHYLEKIMERHYTKPWSFKGPGFRVAEIGELDLQRVFDFQAHPAVKPKNSCFNEKDWKDPEKHEARLAGRSTRPHKQGHKRSTC